jgi:EH domain-containing protein 1
LDQNQQLIDLWPSHTVQKLFFYIQFLKFSPSLVGTVDRTVPGNAAAVDPARPFAGLGKFGTSFLSRFEIAELPSPLLESLTLIDTPGVLSGEKQRVDRGYNFEDIVKWFSERADRILLLFDAHKLDISDEFRRVINVVKNHTEKVRVILNKADQVNTQQLMRVYGALMWSLGKVIQTPEVVRVYIGSFWDQPLDPKGSLLEDLFIKEKEDLIADLKSLQRSCSLRQVNEMVKRTRLVRVLALFVEHLRSDLPMFGKEAKQKKMAETIQSYMEVLMKKHGIAQGDFPEVDKMRGYLGSYNLAELPDLQPRMIELVDMVLAKEIPRMLDVVQKNKIKEEKVIPSEESPFPNPFEKMQAEQVASWVVDPASKAKYDNLFFSLSPSGDPPRVSGAAARPILLQSGLPVEALKKIWDLVTTEGHLDQEEFALVMFLVNSARQNGVNSLPSVLPESYIPPSKRWNQSHSSYGFS